MPQFRVYYLTPERSEAFRGGTGGKPPYLLRRSHYTDGPVISASDPYVLWGALRDKQESGGAAPHKAVAVGDVLESEDGLLLCNFWGFERAEWREGPASACAPANPTPKAEVARGP